MVACERFARLELHLGAAAVLTAVPIAREEECVGDLAAESARDVDEARKTDYSRTRERQALGSYEAIRIGLDDLRLSIDDESECPAHGNHGKGLKRRV